MAHHTVKSAYSSLADRLNRYPLGAPPSDLLFKILKMLVNEREAGLVALMPIRPFSPEKAARIWKMDLAAARNVLEELASRAILVDIERNGRSWYALPPPMAGSSTSSSSQKPSIQPPLLNAVYCWLPPVQVFQFFQ